ncbi:hypothetical protein [Nonomuraea sediminis]|uniref:hypothetical protein n=1 Tax=Nonomuraea sediminis TaxID=2835864 RepID=UPI001BDC013D|nr:hypothetical protein [Nonomuraea sediminis]
MGYKRGDAVRVNHHGARRDAVGVVESSAWDGTYTVRVGGRTLRGVRAEQLGAESRPFWTKPSEAAAAPRPFWARPPRPAPTADPSPAPFWARPRRTADQPAERAPGVSAASWLLSRARKASPRRPSQAPPLWDE